MKLTVGHKSPKKTETVTNWSLGVTTFDLTGGGFVPSLLQRQIDNTGTSAFSGNVHNGYVKIFSHNVKLTSTDIPDARFKHYSRLRRCLDLFGRFAALTDL